MSLVARQVPLPALNLTDRQQRSTLSAGSCQRADGFHWRQTRSIPRRIPFEGVGIKPDVEIGPTRDNLRTGKDVVLGAARRLKAGE